MHFPPWHKYLCNNVWISSLRLLNCKLFSSWLHEFFSSPQQSTVGPEGSNVHQRVAPVLLVPLSIASVVFLPSFLLLPLEEAPTRCEPVTSEPYMYCCRLQKSPMNRSRVSLVLEVLQVDRQLFVPSWAHLVCSCFLIGALPTDVFYEWRQGIAQGWDEWNWDTDVFSAMFLWEGSFG